MTILGTILCGGRSIRMAGHDKAKIILNGQRLVDHVYHRLRPQVAEIIFSGRENYGFDAVYLPDAIPEIEGPMCGILSTLQYVRNERSDIEGILCVAVDAPFFPTDLNEKLVGKSIAFAAVENKLHPTFSYWPVALFESLLNYFLTTRNYAIRSCLDVFAVKLIQFDDEKLFLNMNTPNDVAYAQKNILAMTNR